MGITFGDKAEVDVGGDMVGRDKIVNAGAYSLAAREIAELDLPLASKTDGIQAVSRIMQEMQADEPSENVLAMAAASIAQAAPQILQSLVTSVPAIMQAAPGIARLLQ